MSEGEDTPITLSREDLYELVWSKPMLELSKDFGISDVALAKRCRRLGIPVWPASIISSAGDNCFCRS
jgi:hypothetical protein